MSSSNRWPTACHIVALVALALGASHAGARTLDLDGVEGQQASRLCWAAASVSAIRMLRTPAELARRETLVTQAELASYRLLIRGDGELASELGVPTDPVRMERLTRAQIESIPLDRRQSRLNDCSTAIGTCNEVNTPILLDLAFDTTQDGQALNWPNIVEQIDSGRPVVFGWTTEDLVAGRDFGQHFSLVTGYRVRRNVREVRLWDPWPVATSGNGGRSHWIPYCTYRHPRIVMGLKAVHQFDRYNLTRVSDAQLEPRRSSPEAITPDDDCGISATALAPPAGVSTIGAAHDAFRNERTIRATLQDSANAIPRRALFEHLGPGLPIVPVSSREILEAGGSADALLVDSVSAVVIPVQRARKIIDSFLVLPDAEQGWIPGGYANTTATALLVQERRRQDADDVYLVSVPAFNAFFLARGLGSEASLTPIWSDEKIGAVAGEARQAAHFFDRFHELLSATP